MAKLLLSMWQVPADEATEVEAMLDAASIIHYRTPPSRWGLGSGGIWVRDDADMPRARALMADYQRERGERARAEHDAARREGRAETLWTVFRAQPLKVLLVLAGLAAVIGLGVLPFFLMMR
jgi:hypothetical protein